MRRVVMAFAAMCGALSGCGGVPAPAPKARLSPPANARDVLKTFVGAKIGVGAVSDVSAASDDNHLLGRPGQYTSKLFFYDSRHPKPKGDSDEGENTIEVFANPADAKTRRDYVEGITHGIPMLLQYQILRGNVLVRLSNVVLPQEADQYKRIVEKSVPQGDLPENKPA